MIDSRARRQQHWGRQLLTAVVLVANVGAGTPAAAAADQDSYDASAEPFADIGGFVEVRIGARTQSDPREGTLSVSEARLQLDVEKDLSLLSIHVVADLVLDPETNTLDVQIERGRGLVDLRQANIVLSPFAFLDLKIGRQIATWGTGDLVFINDLFPKDWSAFLLGRDIEYLKAPTDAVRVSLFRGAFDAEIVYTPRFDADRFVDGRRVSFFDPVSGGRRGRERPLIVERPDSWFRDDEVAARVYRSLGAHEFALYFYRGFWKSPTGRNAATGASTFPLLSVFGASWRGAVLGGIANAEAGYYRGRDRLGSDPLVPNDEFRFLVGYERELATELTASWQYYMERILDYGRYSESLPSTTGSDEYRQLMTMRVTKLLLRQTLTLSLFHFYSPSDNDGSLRWNLLCKMTDAARIELGGNHFYGDRDHTFFAQFENNSSIYTAFRYGF